MRRAGRPWRTLAALLLSIAASGCASTEVRIASGTPPPAAGAHVSVGYSGGATLRAVAIAAALGALFSLERSRTDGASGSAPLSEGMLEDRAINVQDCTRPIERPEANLRCK